jgi:prepilin-type N-terminal cleavage/methylation domain-containing protein
MISKINIKQKNRNLVKAFSLVELSIVILIIGLILAGVTTAQFL